MSTIRTAIMGGDEVDCTVNFYKTSSMINTLECMSFLVITTQLICIFITTYKNRKSNARLTFSITLTFCIITWFQISNLLMSNIFCVMESDFSRSYFMCYIFIGLAYLQIYFLLLTLFIRFKNVLNSTRHRFSRLTCYFFYILFSISALSLTIALTILIYRNTQMVTEILFICCIGTVSTIIILIILIITLFVNKLVKVYKTTDHDDTFIQLITKIILLTFIVIFITLFDVISSALTVYFFSPITFLLYSQLKTIDAFINFYCVMLSYSKFKSHYHILCNYADNICRLCVNKMLIHMIKSENTNKSDKKTASFQIQISNTSNPNPNMSIQNSHSVIPTIVHFDTLKLPDTNTMPSMLMVRSDSSNVPSLPDNNNSASTSGTGVTLTVSQMNYLSKFKHDKIHEIVQEIKNSEEPKTKIATVKKANSAMRLTVHKHNSSGSNVETPETPLLMGNDINAAYKMSSKKKFGSDKSSNSLKID
eukprot:375922_1